jgi:O-antigen/teichoic acid export membrane protein
MPACLCQAACTLPAFQLALPSSWEGAIVFVQMLSVGQMFYFAVNPAMGLLKAQGRFKLFLAWQAAQLVIVVIAMLLAGRFDDGSGRGIVAVFSFYHVISSPVGLALCISDGRARWRAVAKVFITPLATAMLSVGLATLAAQLIPPTVPGNAAKIGTILMGTLIAHPLCLRVFSPGVFADARLFANRGTSRFQRAVD